MNRTIHNPHYRFVAMNDSLVHSNRPVTGSSYRCGDWEDCQEAVLKVIEIALAFRITSSEKYKSGCLSHSAAGALGPMR